MLYRILDQSPSTLGRDHASPNNRSRQTPSLHHDRVSPERHDTMVSIRHRCVSPLVNLSCTSAVGHGTPIHGAHSFATGSSATHHHANPSQRSSRYHPRIDSPFKPCLPGTPSRHESPIQGSPLGKSSRAVRRTVMPFTSSLCYARPKAERSSASRPDAASSRVGGGTPCGRSGTPPLSPE